MKTVVKSILLATLVATPFHQIHSSNKCNKAGLIIGITGGISLAGSASSAGIAALCYYKAFKLRKSTEPKLRAKRKKYLIAGTIFAGLSGACFLTSAGCGTGLCFVPDNKLPEQKTTPNQNEETDDHLPETPEPYITPDETSKKSLEEFARAFSQEFAGSDDDWGFEDEEDSDENELIAPPPRDESNRFDTGDFKELVRKGKGKKGKPKRRYLNEKDVVRVQNLTDLVIEDEEKISDGGGTNKKPGLKNFTLVDFKKMQKKMHGK